LSRVQLGILLFWISIAPVSNLVIQIGTPFGERLLYFPLVFLLLTAVDLLIWCSLRDANLKRGPKLWPAWVVLGVGLGLLSAIRIPEWKDNRSLFRAAVRDCPGYYYSQMAYGGLLLRSGNSVYERELALSSFAAATRITPDAYAPWATLGSVAYMEENDRQASSHFENARARTTGRDREQAVVNLSRGYPALKEFGQAESLLVPAAQDHPGWIEVQPELGDFWWLRGRVREGIFQFERVLVKEPLDPSLWRALIRADLRLGDNEKARLRLQSSPPGTVNGEFRRQLARDGFALPK
jgi:hypothetical protein